MNTNAPTSPAAPEDPASPRKIVVIGGTGLIGSKVVRNLTQLGHEVVAASPSKGINTLTREGLAEAFAGAQVVVDVANSPSFEDTAVMNFFQTAGRNILEAEIAAGVKHHVALSVVGTERLLASGYFRAKLVQEELITSGPIPYTIVRATQFFEFTDAIAQGASQGQTVRLAPAMMQPIFSEDVATAMTEAALAAPRNGMIEIAGPEKIRMDELVKQYLADKGESYEVITDPAAGYFRTPVDDRSLTPDEGAWLGMTHFAEWLKLSGAL